MGDPLRSLPDEVALELIDEAAEQAPGTRTACEVDWAVTKTPLLVLTAFFNAKEAAKRFLDQVRTAAASPTTYAHVSAIGSTFTEPMRFRVLPPLRSLFEVAMVRSNRHIEPIWTVEVRLSIV